MSRSSLGPPLSAFKSSRMDQWIMRSYMLRKTGGIPIDDDFINEVRRISLRRKGLLDDDELI